MAAASTAWSSGRATTPRGGRSARSCTLRFPLPKSRTGIQQTAVEMRPPFAASTELAFRYPDSAYIAVHKPYAGAGRLRGEGLESLVLSLVHVAPHPTTRLGWDLVEDAVGAFGYPMVGQSVCIVHFGGYVGPYRGLACHPMFSPFPPASMPGRCR